MLVSDGSFHCCADNLRGNFRLNLFSPSFTNAFTRLFVDRFGWSRCKFDAFLPKKNGCTSKAHSTSWEAIVANGPLCKFCFFDSSTHAYTFPRKAMNAFLSLSSDCFSVQQNLPLIDFLVRSFGDKALTWMLCRISRKQRSRVGKWLLRICNWKQQQPIIWQDEDKCVCPLRRIGHEMNMRCSSFPVFTWRSNDILFD